jgi:four helix bundle protein
MAFDHERLDVYRAALRFAVAANEIVQVLPRGRSYLADQLTRASLSIVLNIAEGAGKYSRADKRRYYVTASGSATECAAILDIGHALALIDEATWSSEKVLLERIVSMLIKLSAVLSSA